MIQNTNELLLVAIKYGIIPSTIMAFIIMNMIQKGSATITNRRLIFWFSLSFFISICLVVILITVLFITLISGALF